MPSAIKVTEKNLDFIIDFGRDLKFRLDDIKYDLEDAIDNGYDLYLITDGSKQNDNVTFTTRISSDFFRTWKFATTEMPDSFMEIVRL